MQQCFYCQHWLGHGDDSGKTGTCSIDNVVKRSSDGRQCKSFDDNKNEKDKKDGK